MKRGNQTIILPIEATTYEEMLSSARDFKLYMEYFITHYPELFPTSIYQNGYSLDGFSRSSEKVSIRRRVICIDNRLVSCCNYSLLVKKHCF